MMSDPRGETSVIRSPKTSNNKKKKKETGHLVSPWMDLIEVDREQNCFMCRIKQTADIKKQVANLTLMSARQSLVLSSFVLMVTARGFLFAFRGFMTAESQSHLRIHHSLLRTWKIDWRNEKRDESSRISYTRRVFQFRCPNSFAWIDPVFPQGNAFSFCTTSAHHSELRVKMVTALYTY